MAVEEPVVRSVPTAIVPSKAGLWATFTAAGRVTWWDGRHCSNDTACESEAAPGQGLPASRPASSEASCN